MRPEIILTFDLEEFDLPLEYSFPISEEDQFGISSKGLRSLAALLEAYNVKATIFTTGNYCERFPETVKSLAVNHEIASHSYFHSRFDEEFIIRSKRVLEEASGKPVKGFRMPRFQKVDYKNLTEAGFSYDSSINPTFLPGRYNNFKVSRTPYKIPGTPLTEFPVSVSPALRFPLSWYAFKNLPLPLFKSICRSVLNHDKFIHLYFHPWEFADLDSFKIPGYIKKPSGEKYIKKFGNLLAWLSKNGEFVTITEFLEKYKF